jgi:pimeloyl-ACP methyl ester carboxylesterase
MQSTYTDSVRSLDGTTITYNRSGEGPSLVFVDGAFCTRSMGPGHTLAPAVSDRTTTFVYDRRGRGDSGDAPNYEPNREIEDLAPVIDAAGRSAYVFGHSSGAVLALEAARAGLPIRGLVLYEPPFVVDNTRPPVAADFPERMAALAAAGKRRAVVRSFMTEAIRAPKPVAVLMSIMPGGGRLAPIAHTVAYDATLMNPYQRGNPLPIDIGEAVRMPTLVVAGGKSPQWIQTGGEALAALIPSGDFAQLPGQSHMVKAKATAPVVAAFIAEASSSAGSTPPSEGAGQ